MKGPVHAFPTATAALLLGLSLFFSRTTLALDELFDIYIAPQALAMGNAFTADATGYAALFHNPAGLAKNQSVKWDVTPLGLDILSSAAFLTPAWNAKAFWADSVLSLLQANTYNYFRFNIVPSASYRGFAFGLLGAYEFAALSNGSTVDMQYHTDFGPVVGFATNLASNMIKLGVSATALLRNQMVGTYALSSLTGNHPTAPYMEEGIGLGANFGAMFTVPLSYLPTLGFVWKNIAGTYFQKTNIFNKSGTSAPATIPQSFNLAFSVHPALFRGIRGIFSAEIQHLERSDILLRKRLHFGAQVLVSKSWYLWAGLNQLYPTGGMGLRSWGGDFEVGSYAQDVGTGTATQADRRFTLRYTISF